MRTITRYFGPVPYAPETVLHFPAGLPGFRGLRRFLPIEIEEHRPLVFLQSLEDAEICFLALPAGAVDAGYRLEVEPPDLELLALARRPRIGREVLCLFMVTVDAERITANLLAPVVINLANRWAAQVIQACSGYSHQHVLAEQEAAVCC